MQFTGKRKEGSSGSRGGKHECVEEVKGEGNCETGRSKTEEKQHCLGESRKAS